LPSPPPPFSSFCFRIARRPGCICMVTTLSLLFSLACLLVSMFVRLKCNLRSCTQRNARTCTDAFTVASLIFKKTGVWYPCVVLRCLMLCCAVIKHRYNHITPSFQNPHSIFSPTPLRPSSHTNPRPREQTKSAVAALPTIAQLTYVHASTSAPAPSPRCVELRVDCKHECEGREARPRQSGDESDVVRLVAVLSGRVYRGEMWRVCVRAYMHVYLTEAVGRDAAGVA
jgi:hypothetical protein